MPIIEVHLLEGQPAGVRTRIMNGIVDAYRMVVPVPPAAITVMLHELKRENYMRGGAMRRRTEALADPGTVIMAYLAALQSTDFDAVRALLTEDCTFRMPGGRVFETPEEMADWAKPRTRSFNYSRLAFETAAGEHGPIVYVRGVLSGEWPDGTPFEDVSTATRFEFRGSKIRRLELWHDLAEKRPPGLSRPGAPDTDSADR